MLERNRPFIKVDVTENINQKFDTINQKIGEHDVQLAQTEQELIEIRNSKADKKTLSSFSGLATALEMNNASFAIQVLGDSTGNENWEWVYKFSQWLTDNYQGFNVIYRLWSDSMKSYQSPISLRTISPTYVGGGTNTRTYSTSETITGDIDISVKMELPNWTNGATTTPVSRFGSVESERSWYFSVLNDGKLRFIWTPNGSGANLKVHTSTESVPFLNGETGWVRVAFDADNGTGGCTAFFYTSVNGVTWNTLGAPVTLSEVATLNPVTYPYELGGRGQIGEILPSGGKIYEVYVKNGIDGFTTVPVMPDLWEARSNGLSHKVYGSPTLTIVNGSHPGSNLAYLSNHVRRMTPNYGQSIVFISNSHNQGASINERYRNEYAAFVDSVQERIPYVPIVAIAQNPQQTGAIFHKEHAIRRKNIYEVARRKGLEVLDVFSAFPDDFSAYMMDSVHPNELGQDLWCDVVIKELRYV